MPSRTIENRALVMAIAAVIISLAAARAGDARRTKRPASRTVVGLDRPVKAPDGTRFRLELQSTMSSIDGWGVEFFALKWRRGKRRGAATLTSRRPCFEVRVGRGVLAGVAHATYRPAATPLKIVVFRAGSRRKKGPIDWFRASSIAADHARKHAPSLTGTWHGSKGNGCHHAQLTRGDKILYEVFVGALTGTILGAHAR